MLKRRRVIRIAIAALLLPAAWLMASQARAQQSFQAFFPLLVELSGWKGGKPDGAAVEIPGSKMVSASRQYQRGGARLDAQVLIGAAAAGAASAAGSGVKIETADARMSTSTIDGLQVTRTFTISDKSGAVIVILGPSAVFMLSFNGIADDEALTLARQFNWKALQAATK
jgi:hypothetical protein